jgi:uncharacterized protein YhdP
VQLLLGLLEQALELNGWRSTKSAASTALSSSMDSALGTTQSTTEFGQRWRTLEMNAPRPLKGGVASLTIRSIWVSRSVRSASSSVTAVNTELSYSSARVRRGRIASLADTSRTVFKERRRPDARRAPETRR